MWRQISYAHTANVFGITTPQWFWLGLVIGVVMGLMLAEILRSWWVEGRAKG